MKYSMVHYIVCCRQVNKSCSSDHAFLITIFNVLCKVQHLAGVLLSGYDVIHQPIDEVLVDNHIFYLYVCLFVFICMT